MLPLSGTNVPILAQIGTFWLTKLIKTCTRLSVQIGPFRSIDWEIRLSFSPVQLKFSFGWAWQKWSLQYRAHLRHFLGARLSDWINSYWICSNNLWLYHEGVFGTRNMSSYLKNFYFPTGFRASKIIELTWTQGHKKHRFKFGTIWEQAGLSRATLELSFNSSKMWIQNFFGPIKFLVKKYQLQKSFGLQ